MAELFAKMAAKRIFKETVANKQGQQDPFFETVPARRLGFTTKKRQTKALPPGLTVNEERCLVKAKRRAYKIDMGLGSFMGIKLGYGALIGLVPGFGDVADMLLALMVFRTMCSVEGGLDAALKVRMQINIIIDFVIGLIPFVGDVADAMYKCNTKNVILFEDMLRKRGEKRIRGTPLANMPDPSLPDEFDYQAEEQAMAQNGPPPRYSSRRGSQRAGRDQRRPHDLEAAADRPVPPPRPARTG
ncbi:hypothetical protein DV736_g6098, partial [Chaetothyriales sp. CBS 134916]